MEFSVPVDKENGKLERERATTQRAEQRGVFRKRAIGVLVVGVGGV